MSENDRLNMIQAQQIDKDKIGVYLDPYGFAGGSSQLQSNMFVSKTVDEQISSSGDCKWLLKLREQIDARINKLYAEAKAAYEQSETSLSNDTLAKLHKDLEFATASANAFSKKCEELRAENTKLNAELNRR